MPDIDTLPTYGAVRAAYVRDREQQQRRHTRGIPTDAQRAQWSAEFDAWADAIHAAAWDDRRGHHPHQPLPIGLTCLACTPTPMTTP